MKYLFITGINCIALVLFSLAGNAQSNSTADHNRQLPGYATEKPAVSPPATVPVYIIPKAEDEKVSEEEVPRIPEIKAESTEQPAPAQEKKITTPAPPKNNREVS